MALHYDVVNSLRELREAKRDLELSLRLKYKEGTKVSFVNPNHNDKSRTVYTGTLRNYVLDLNAETAIVYIEIDEQFLPLPWGDATLDLLIRINMLNPEYEITIIG